MMVLESYVEGFAQVAQAVGLVAREPPAHPSARADLGKPKLLLQAPEFAAQEPIVEVDVMGYKDAVPHKIHETVGDLREQRRSSHHFVRDTGQLHDLARDRSLRVQQ